MRRELPWSLLLALSFTSCGTAKPVVVDPAIPFDRVMVYTPREKIAAVVQDIIATIGVKGGARARLAVVLVPISFDHTDDEVRRIIDDGFAIVRAQSVAVGFHLDDSMFWSRRTDLMTDPDNVEWTDFAGTRSTGLLLNWAHPPAKMCFNAPKIRAEVTRRAPDVIGAAIAAHVTCTQGRGNGGAPGIQHLSGGRRLRTNPGGASAARCARMGVGRRPRPSYANAIRFIRSKTRSSTPSNNG